jgi:O-antigen ligase
MKEDLRGRIVSTSALFWSLGFFTCTWDLLLTKDVGPITFKIHQLFFLLSFASGLLALAQPFSKLWQLLKHPFALGILSLVFFYFCSTLWSYFPLKSFLYSGWILFNFLTIWTSLQLLEGRLTTDYLIKLILGTASFISLIILVDQGSFWFGFEAGLIGYNQNTTFTQGLSRPHAFAMEPSYAATFLALAVILACPWAIRSPIRYGRIAALVVSLAAMALTTSRTGWFGFILGMIFILIFITLKNRSLPWRELAALALAAVIIKGSIWAWTSESHRTVISQQLIGGIRSGNDGSSAGRLAGLKNALAFSKETNFLGVGLGASWRYWQETRGKNAPASSGNENFGDEAIMSIWGQLLAEGGIVAVLLYALAGFTLVFGLWQAYRYSGDPLVLGALSACLVFYCLIALLIGNVARGDIWVWLAIWSGILSSSGRTVPPSLTRNSN